LVTAACVYSGATASAAWAGRVNIVMCLRPRDRPLR
jgi:hypothetical protein